LGIRTEPAIFKQWWLWISLSNCAYFWWMVASPLGAAQVEPLQRRLLLVASPLVAAHLLPIQLHLLVVDCGFSFFVGVPLFGGG
jgi:hypothetical protein